ncbi:hypothetical protein RCL1_001763 [Eukaryota sp. TZLM3-RCL]
MYKLLLLISALIALSLARSIPFSIFHTTDVHGWLLPKRHNPLEDADFGDLLSFVEHANKTAIKEGRNFLLFDTGDQVQGTGLSDATPVIGSVVLQATDKIPYDGLTIGNHELGVPETIDWMRTNYRHLKEGRVVSGNVIYSDGKHFAAQSRTMYSSGTGHKVLVLGFMYNDQYPHKNTIVQTVEKTVTSSKFISIMKESQDVAFIVVMCHFEHSNPETLTIHNQIRRFLPKTGIVYLTGHTHQQKWQTIDNNAIAMESGCYYHSVGRIDFAFDDSTGKLDKVSHKWIKANRQALIAESGVSESQFDTDNGLALKKFLVEQFKKLGLDKVLGCAKQKLDRYAPISQANSVFKLFLNDIFPSFMNKESKNQQILIMNTGSVRAHIFQGEVTVDDLMSVDPFDNVYVTFPDLTILQLQALLGKVHMSADMNGGLPKYYHSWYFDTYPGYDVVTDDYTAIKLQAMLEAIDPSRVWEYYPYKTKFNTSRKAWHNFIVNSPDWKCPTETSLLASVPYTSVLAYVGGAVVFTAFVSLLVGLFGRRSVKSGSGPSEDLVESLL